ncbi:MAG: HAD-IA family hydrolase [Magnetococcales bacterium]|nr:HAD-IA family hydrolase [Magnetococcales bacterium]
MTPPSSSPSHRFNLVVFDCDGTLMDSLDNIWRTINQAMRNRGFDRAFSRQEVAGIVGLSLETAFAHLLPEATEAVWRSLALAYKEEFRRLASQGLTEAPLFSGVAETLRLLYEAGMVLAVATGKSKAGLERSLRAHDLESWFTFFQTADSAPSKPHPAMLTQILDQSGFSPNETLMVGDTDFDILMARNAGVASCAVTFGCHNRQRLAAAAPDYWLDNMIFLPTLLGL